MSRERTLFSRRFHAGRPGAWCALAWCAGVAWCLGLGAAIPIRAGTVSPPYQIGTWQGFRQAAITFTFDDNQPNQYAVAVPMFDAVGFKLTLFTVISYADARGNWAAVQTAAAHGHEVASHTVSHLDLTTLSAEEVTNELQESQSLINAHIPGQQCLSVAYPECLPPLDESVVAAFYIAGRICDEQLIPPTPPDFMAISAKNCGTEGLLQVQDLIAQADAAASAGAWCVYELHALDNDPGWSPLPSANLQATLNYLSTNSSTFWVETFSHVVCYIRERDAASVLETASSPDSLTLQVTHDLDNAIYNYPLTLRRPLPADWPGATATQMDQRLAARFLNLNGTNYVMFDVVPNGGDLTLTKEVVPVVITQPVRTPPGSFSFRLEGQAGARYAIYSSDDLVDWAPVQTNLLVGWSTNCTVPAPAGRQFYRARWLP